MKTFLTAGALASALCLGACAGSGIDPVALQRIETGLLVTCAVTPSIGALANQVADAAGKTSVKDDVAKGVSTGAAACDDARAALAAVKAAAPTP